MVGQYEIQWGPLSAGVMISTIPVAVLFVFLQRHLIRGLTAGALKGSSPGPEGRGVKWKG